MVLSTAIKVGVGTVLVAGGIAGAAYGINSMTKTNHPKNIQRILDWEKKNGGCRIYMVVSSSDDGELYRPGNARNEKITDSALEELWGDLTTESNSAANKSDCKKGKGKDLVLANRSSTRWKKDTDAGSIVKWKKKLGDNLVT